jgi:hypothetical protein
MMKRTNQAFVETRYIGPTNFRCARVAVVNVTSRKRLVFSWDNEFNDAENHERAARAALGFGAGQPYRGDLLSASTERGWIYTAKVSK